MKENFILHHDSLSVINELTDEQAGMLIKEIYAYSVYINNPNKAKKPTGLIGLMSSVAYPFKMQLDRDLAKYKGVVEKNSNNGKKGGRPKKEKTQKKPTKPKKADSDSDSEDIIINTEVINYLNRVTNKKFRATNNRHLIARVNEGYKFDDFKKVIDVKSSQWINTEHEKYLRPDTLFGSKFDGYLNERLASKKQVNMSEEDYWTMQGAK